VAQEPAAEYQATIAEVIAVAESCSDQDWQALCPNEQRTVGVLFDHIAVGNRDVVAWIESFLAGEPVRITPEMLHAENAEHAQRVAGRPRTETIADLKESSARTVEFIRGLNDEQLQVTQEFAWAGSQDVGWLALAAVRHPRNHLKSIRDALGR
jgi:hypothetical protein